MSIFARLFGSADSKPEDLQTIPEAAQALERIRHTRTSNGERERQIISERRKALEGDAPDAAILKLDRELERLGLESERLDTLAPRVIGRLTQLQSAERAALLGELRRLYDTRTVELDAALAAGVSAFENYCDIVGQIDLAGFGAEARSFVVSAPIFGDGVMASPTALENWRRAREHVSDMHALASMPRPVAKPVAPPPAPKPVAEPAPVEHFLKRAPKKLGGPVPPGYVRVRCVLNNVDFHGFQCVAGDMFDVVAEEANFLSGGVAFEFVAPGAELGEAAE